MNQENIGKFIKEKRLECEMTQEQLAEKLHVSNKSVSKWELGKCMPSIDLLIPLCKNLGIELNELLEGREVENKKESYEKIILETLKRKKQNRINLIFGIILCLFLCGTDVLLLVGHTEDKIANLIFLVIIVFLLLIDLYEYLMYKRK